MAYNGSKDEERYQAELLGLDYDKPGTFLPPSLKKGKFKSAFLRNGDARTAKGKQTNKFVSMFERNAKKLAWMKP